MLVGAHDLTDVNIPGDLADVDDVIIHPEFEDNTDENDIALLHVATPLSLSPDVAAVCLSEQVSPLSTDCYITGWGSLSESTYCIISQLYSCIACTLLTEYWFLKITI